jgi:glucose-6-phosphate-specific signal transduction histidine kinase
VNFSVWPRRTSSTQWVLGSVSFVNIRWYNAVFVGLAPLLTLLVPLAIAMGRQKLAYPYGWQDILAASLIAPIYLGSLPSQKDMLITLRSWPYFAAAAAGAWWIWSR